MNVTTTATRARRRAACIALLAAGAATPVPATLAAQEADFALFDLGSCALESGQTLEPCHVGYRTFGTLADDRSNAVLVPTWFGGTSGALAPFIRPGGLVDPERFFVVIADALGNGVSSSPSNHADGGSFPPLAIGDMVEAHRELLRERFGIERLAGVVGISMGGMQVFDWVVRYPDAVDAAVAIAGSPRAGSYDRVAWDAYLRLADLMEGPGRPEAGRVLAALEYLRGSSPGFVARTVPHDSVANVIQGFEHDIPSPGAIRDLASQGRAIAANDVSRAFGGDLRRAAERVRARMTIIVTASDHTVTPGSAIEFAEHAGATLIVLDNDCGHAGANCDAARVLSAVAETLAGAGSEATGPSGEASGKASGGGEL